MNNLSPPSNNVLTLLLCNMNPSPIALVRAIKANDCLFQFLEILPED